MNRTQHRTLVLPATLSLILVASLSACLSADRDAVVRVGNCSGVCVTPDGLVLSARHCGTPETTEVLFHDRTVTANRVYVHPGGDDNVVVFRCAAGRYPHLAIATQPPQVGEAVVSYGYPGGKFDVLSGVMLRGPVTDNTGKRVFAATLPIRGGHSGGPLINLKGEVIGLANASSTAKVPQRIEGRGYSTWIRVENLQAAIAAVGATVPQPDRSPGWRSTITIESVPALVVFSSDRCEPCQRFEADRRSGHFGEYQIKVVKWTSETSTWSDPALYQEFVSTANPTERLAFPTFWIRGTTKYRVGYAPNDRSGLLGWISKIVRHIVGGLIGQQEPQFPLVPQPDPLTPSPSPGEKTPLKYERDETVALISELLKNVRDLRQQGKATAADLRAFKDGGLIAKLKAVGHLKAKAPELIGDVTEIRGEVQQLRDRFKLNPMAFLWQILGGLGTGLLRRRFAH